MNTTTSSRPLAGMTMPQRRRVGLWRTVLGCEWQLARSDAGTWLALLLLLACVACALFSGQQRVLERRAAVAVAQQDHAQRLGSLQRQLVAVEAGTAKPAVEPWRDPTNPIGVGRGSGAAVAHWADAPLAATAVGLSDLYPASFRVGVGSRDRFLFADEINNPLQLATGSFDLAFVTVYLLPLVLVALSYNVLSGEREQGTWALTAASSAPLLPILLAKLLVRNGGVLAAFVLATGAGLAWQGAPLASAEGAGALAAWAATVLLYAAFWVALALAVNAAQRSSAFNAVALVMAWVLLLVVAPAAINAVAQALYPAPARAEVVLAVRQAAVDADRDREAEQARFRAEHGLAAPGAAPERRALALVLAADQRADAVLTRHEALVRQQRDLTSALSVFSPAMRVNDTLAELAGNGHNRWDAYLQRVDQFHGQWQDFFVARAQSGTRLGSADLAQFPRFAADRTSTWVGGVRRGLATTWGVLLACVGAMLWWSRRALNR